MIEVAVLFIVIGFIIVVTYEVRSLLKRRWGENSKSFF